MRIKSFAGVLVLCVSLVIAMLWLMGDWLIAVNAAPAGELHVCSSGCTYTSVQAAVDAASDGDVIKVAAGTYTGVSARNGVTQVVYLDKGADDPGWLHDQRLDHIRPGGQHHHAGRAGTGARVFHPRRGGD